MANRAYDNRPTGSGSIHGFDQILWRAFFLVELAIAALVVFGIGKVVVGDLHDLWPGAIFCFSFVFALVIDPLVKRFALHRRPLLSPAFAIIVGILFLAAVMGLAWISSH